MATRSKRDLLSPVRAIRPQTINQATSPEYLVSSGVDLRGFDSAMVVVEFGDIDEMGTSPVGTAKIDVKLEHSDDNSDWSSVSSNDVDNGDVTVTGGVVATTQTDVSLLKVGYIGSKRYIRVTLSPLGLTNGGPVTALVVKGHAHLTPVA